MSTRARGNRATLMGFMAVWMVRGVARQLGIDTRARSREAKVTFHELMLRKWHRVPAPLRGVLFAGAVTARAGWRVAHHGGRSAALAWRHGSAEARARHAEWVERGEHPKGSAGRDHVLEQHRVARSGRWVEHQAHSDLVHAATGVQVRAARERSAETRLRVAETEMKVANATGTKEQKAAAKGRHGRAVARLTRQQAAVLMGIGPVVEALVSVAETTAAPTVPAPATVPAAVVVPDPLTSGHPSTNGHGPAPSPAAVPMLNGAVAAMVRSVHGKTSGPALTLPIPDPTDAGTGPVTTSNGHGPTDGVTTKLRLPTNGVPVLTVHTNNTNGSPVMTAPTSTATATGVSPQLGDITTTDQVKSVYSHTEGQAITAGDQLGAMAEEYEKLAAAMRDAAAQLAANGLDQDSGSELAATAEAVQRGATLAREASAALVDAGGLAQANRTTFTNRVTALEEAVNGYRGTPHTDMFRAS